MRYRCSIQTNGKHIKKAVVYTRNEHGIDPAGVDADAVRIVERLSAAGYETYIVGGAVRDLLLHKKPKDFDIVTSAHPNQIKRLFCNARIIGHRFRLVHVPAGEKIFEVSTFRSIAEGSTSNLFGTVEEDVLRRDFTINALFYEPSKQLVIDYVGGMKDIRGAHIKPIIPLKTIFTDDPVRMIRAVKYASTSGFKLPLALGWKIRKQAALLDSVSPSRRTEEIFKIIRSSSAAKIVENLENLGLYRFLQPNSSQRMKEDAMFREKYLSHLAALNQGDTLSSNKESLSALIEDYLESVVDWKEQTPEAYKKAFFDARAFVLPMNPPRFDLDGAVKLIYQRHGISIKRALYERERPRRKGTQTSPAKGAPEPVKEASPAAPKSPHKKRVRKKKKAAPREQTPVAVISNE